MSQCFTTRSNERFLVLRPMSFFNLCLQCRTQRLRQKIELEKLLFNSARYQWIKLARYIFAGLRKSYRLGWNTGSRCGRLIMWSAHSAEECRSLHLFELEGIQDFRHFCLLNLTVKWAFNWGNVYKLVMVSLHGVTQFNTTQLHVSTINSNLDAIILCHPIYLSKLIWKLMVKVINYIR